MAINRISSDPSSWTKEYSLPYGWESAVDSEGKNYYINHLNKTTTYEDPRKEDDEPPPQPREITLHRDADLGFGFVAGSEKPVVIRFVKEGGPSESRLQSGDQILRINGEDVSKAPREHVIELVKSCKQSVTLLVCQPHTSNPTTRKSAILTAAKKAKLKSHPCRVRFAEGVVINGAPLLCPVPFEAGVPFIPNVLKVFLENGQTKTFKCDSSTCVQDVLNSLNEKLSITCKEHFSLCVEHIKSMRRNKLTLLDPKDSLLKIAARPGAHNLRCLYRVAFVPKDPSDFLQRDPISFEYLYGQCCNDVVQERFSPELKYEIALSLAALHLHQHAISNGMLSSSGKVNIKAIEKECGLQPFVPYTLLESMKRKELHKLLAHFLKQNQQLCPSGQKTLTALQAKVHYLRIVGELPSYGAKLFPTNIRESAIESALLVSPKYGLSHVSGIKNCAPISLTRIEDIISVKVTKDDELCYTVALQLRGSSSVEPPVLRFGLEEKDAEELVIALKGYHRLFCTSYHSTETSYRELPVSWNVGESWWADSAPLYHGHHLVKETQSALGSGASQYKRVDLNVQSRRPSDASVSGDVNRADSGGNYSSKNTSINAASERKSNVLYSGDADSNGLDLPSIISTEILEAEANCNENGDSQHSSEEAVKRVVEMNQIVADAESYLVAGESDTTLKKSKKALASSSQQKTSPNGSGHGRQTSDSESVNSHEEGDASQQQLKAADSLLLLTQLAGDEVTKASLDSVKAVAEKSANNGNLSGGDSDTDSASTSNESPSHRLAELASDRTDMNLIEKGTSLKVDVAPRNASNSLLLSTSERYSMGLDLNEAENELIETLRNIQDGHAELQFPEGSLYLDTSDIIDLTQLPPPETPSQEHGTRFTPGSLLIYADQRHPDTPPTPYREDGSSITAPFSHLQTNKKSLDSARVVADLDQLCDTLSEMRSSPQPGPTLDSIKHLPHNIDAFIASLSVPPPPQRSAPSPSALSSLSSASQHAYSKGDKSATALAEEEDIYASLVIPAPPPISMGISKTQDDVIAKFWRATDDVKKMCAPAPPSKNSGGHAVGESSPRVAVREVHSSSSGDSGYESVVPLLASGVPSEWQNGSHTDQSANQKCHLPTVQEGRDSERTGSSSRNSQENSFVESASYSDLKALHETAKESGLAQRDEADGADTPGKLSRSHSWSSLNGSKPSLPNVQPPDVPSGKPPRAPKPPIPPGSPSIQERRRQLASKKAAGQLPGPSSANKQPKREATLHESQSEPSADNNSYSYEVYVEASPSMTMDEGCYESVRWPELDEIFIQSQRDIDVLLVRLEEVHESRLQNYPSFGAIEAEKFAAAREALVNEARQFVTASKLFVKCATESAPQVLDLLLECVAILQRMFSIGEMVVMSVESQAQITCLVDRLKEVAATYAYTVDTVHKFCDAGLHGPHDPSSSPYMGLLMTHATSLATALSALIRTLRALS